MKCRYGKVMMKMDVSTDGVAGSSSKPEPSLPSQITSHLDEKKVSPTNNTNASRKKRYLLECIERSDGSLSACNLIPLTEREDPRQPAEKRTDLGLPPYEGKPEAAIAQCAPDKCLVPRSKYKEGMKKRPKPVGEIDKNG